MEDEKMDSSVAVPRKLWEHPDPQSTNMWKFMQTVNRKHGLQLQTFRDLYTYSITQRARFWSDVFEASNLIHSGTYARVVDESAPIDAVPRWFDGVSLNFAENMLFSRGAADPPGHRGVGVDVGYGGDHRPDAKAGGRTAVTEVREGASATRHVSWRDLRREAGRLAAAMRARGVRRGDRVVVVGANSVETLLVWLAAAWLGAIFSSSSTDTGVAGILQRTTQVDPKLLFMDDAALYNGKVMDLREKMGEVVRGLRDQCRSFLGAVTMPRFAEPKDPSRIPLAETWADFVARGRGQSVPEFARIGFHEPFLICYSSGTTGMPKAIVHSVGGAVLNYFKEGVLHEGVGPDTTSLQYTTVGWIMYVAAVAPLLFGARCVLYDGSPFTPDVRVLLRVAERESATKLGVSPRWLLEQKKAGAPPPREAVDLSHLRVVTSTGMVLSDELFEWFYDAGFPRRAHLGNISGGTDIAGCFGLMNPLTPVYVGGTQGPSLGIHVAVYDSQPQPDGTGRAVPDGTAGELVAVAAFPNVPCMFWGDEPSAPAPGPRYRAAYFDRFPHAWAHGDYCRMHPRTGNLAILGRADGVLNPSGVRFGSADIYGVVERRFADRVQDALCVGQRRPQDADESVMLFLLMRPGCAFDRALVQEVRDAIGKDLSKRHIPRYIFETPAIPATTTGKKIEIAVKHIVSGQRVKPSGAVANPESLEYYYQFARMEEVVGPREKL